MESHEGQFGLTTLAIRFWATPQKRERPILQLVPRRIVWPELGGDSSNILQFHVHAVLEYVTSDEMGPTFAGRVCDSCMLSELASLLGQLTHIEESVGEDVRLMVLDGAVDLRLRIVDAARSIALVCCRLDDPAEHWRRSTELVRLCEEFYSPGTLEFSFLTDQSLLARTRSDIEALLDYFADAT